MLLCLCAAGMLCKHEVVSALNCCCLTALEQYVFVNGGALCAVPALCPRCAKSRPFFTTGSHGSRGPEFCTLQPLLVHQGFFVLVWCLPQVPGS